MPLIDDHLFSGPAEPFDAPCQYEDCGLPCKEHASGLTRSLPPEEAAARLEAMHAALARHPNTQLPSLSDRLELFYRATGTSPRELEPAEPDDDDESPDEDERSTQDRLDDAISIAKAYAAAGEEMHRE